MAGTLIAMGGAVQPDGSALKTFYEYSGGFHSRIVVIPTASQRDGVGEDYANAFLRFGLDHPARVLPIYERSDAYQEEYAQAIREATGIFLTGGKQMRLAAALGGTPVHREMLSQYQKGAVVAGSSAGAAALSSVMIAFGRSGSYPRQRLARLGPGLGFISTAIIDQHFRQRNHMGRLLYAVTSNPGLLGIGIDEDTAAIIQGSQITVTGSGAVTIVDGSTITESNVAEVTIKQVIAMSCARLHVLTRGCLFDIETRTAKITCLRS